MTELIHGDMVSDGDPSPFRVSYPYNGWVQISKPVGYELPPELEKALRLAAEIPGVRIVQPDSVQIPENAFSVPEVAKFFGLTIGHETHPPFRNFHWRHSLSESLYSHQREAVERIQVASTLLLADEMGVGKSFTAIEAVRTSLPDDQTVLIIGPKFVRNVWLNELLKFKAIRSESEFCALESRDLKDSSWSNSATWYFCHYDVLSTWWTAILNRLQSRRLYAVIADEAHALRNSKAQRTVAASIAISSAPMRILLTGTPMANRPSELWSLLTMLTGPGSWGSKYGFRLRYCGSFHNGHGLEDTLPTNVDELQLRMKGVYLRREIKDVGLNLPSLTRQVLEVNLDTKTREQHDKTFKHGDMKSIIEALKGKRAGDNTLYLIDKARKITSEAKLTTTIDYVKSAIEQGESVVVFTWMKETAQEIADQLEVSHLSTPLFRISGDLSQKIRDLAVEEFQRTGGVIVATLSSLKEGVTLHRARLVVLHDLDWVPSNLLQGEGRLFRIGQTRPVISTWVLAKDSIDTIFAKVLLEKASQNSEVLNIDAASKLASDLGFDASSHEDELEALISQWTKST